MLLHKEFLEDFFRYITSQERVSDGEVERVPWGRELIICPEPITFLSELDDFSNDQKACIQAFRNILKTRGRKVSADTQPGPYWINTTTNGINLRPGMERRETVPKPVRMGDAAVHGLMAGQTGSGKSAMLNNMIFNLLAEYPPWELDLYLADFKRVEFSRYMNKFVTPHVSACAATGEIRYVISMIQYLVDCMNARESLFARLGVQKLADLRNSKEYMDIGYLVLPRILLIVDEFQQMFLEANSRETDHIRSMLTAIVKKGRATGLHILFASQGMSNTLSPSDLANFRIRFCLNCTRGDSVQVIGNGAAEGIKRGEVIFNTSDGTVGSNTYYLVPYVRTERDFGQQYSYFEEFLGQLRYFEEHYGFTKTQKFYQEDLQAPFTDADAMKAPGKAGAQGTYDKYLSDTKLMSLEEILKRTRRYRMRYFEGDNRGRYFEVLTLGDYVTYSNLRYDIQTLFLEYGRGRNILAVTSSTEDLAYLEKLLAFNFRYSPRRKVTGTGYEHILFSFQPGLENIFPLEKAIRPKQIYRNPEELDSLQKQLLRRKTLRKLCVESETPLEFATGNCRANLSLQRGLNSQERAAAEDRLLIIYPQLFGGIGIEDIPEAVPKLLENPDLDVQDRKVAENLRIFYEYSQDPDRAFPPTVIWISGIDTVERIPDWLLQGMKNGSDMNLLFILLAGAEFDQMSNIARACDYIFLSGSNSRIYDRLQVNYTRREPDSIVIDLYIRSAGESRSFKKYKCSFGRALTPTIPFDEIFGAQAGKTGG